MVGNLFNGAIFAVRVSYYCWTAYDGSNNFQKYQRVGGGEKYGPKSGN